MRLSALVAGLAPVELASAEDREFAGFALDSRNVVPGDLYCALAGANADGHDYVNDAVALGSVAVLAERPVGDCAVPVVIIPDLRARLSGLAGRFFGDPSASVACVGVTGTNGKTSITHHLAQLFEAAGVSAAVGGTLGWGRPDIVRARAVAKDPQIAANDPQLTTEDPIAVQRHLARLAAEGVTWAALEVSSHALDQSRVAGVRFRTAVFSNLTRDHLDYHGTMAAYEAAKRRLFRQPTLQLAVVNRDDPVGASIADECRNRCRVLTFGEHPSADIRWTNVRADRPGGGITGTWITPWGSAPLDLPLIGGFSVANVAAALAVVVDAGVTLEAAAAACGALSTVPGRMDFISVPGAPMVVVDFAHTPDALTQALQALRPSCEGRLVCVVGCGGDRDKGKRPQMARAAEADADSVWLTSDNPRTEEPQCILNDMRAGLEHPADVRIEVDRARAITDAIQTATSADVVLIAGKGHEQYQDIGGMKHPYSDTAVVRRVLEVA